jgi:hypothetical protein
MRIECENCQDVVEVTAKTVVAPFICSVCVNDATPSPAFVPCTNPGCDDCTDKMCDANDMVDGESLPSPVQQSPLTNWSLEGKANLLKVLAKPNVQAQLADKGDIDYTAVAAAMSIPDADPCDTASVENTTLLIEDLQQQLQDERAVVVALEGQVQNQADLIKQQEGHIDQGLTTIADLLKDRSRLAAQAEALGKEKFEIERASIIALEGELATAKESVKGLTSVYSEYHSKVEQLTKQVQNQANIIKEQEGHIDQDLSAIVRLLGERAQLGDTVELLDERNLRQHKSIALYQEQEVKLQGQVTFWKAMTEKWTRRAEGARDLAIARKGIIADLRRHPIREYFRNAWN